MSEEGSEEGDEQAALPRIDFSTFVMSLAHAVLVHLGDAPDPDGSRRIVSLELARQNVDLLALLQEKTAGNLSGQEERILAQAVMDLQLRYVEVAKKLG